MNEKRLKIIMLGDSRSFHLERLVRELKSSGHEVCLASLEQGEMEHVLLKRKGIIKSLHYTLATCQVDKLIEQFEPGIIYAHYATGYGHLASLLKNPQKLPVLLNLWGSDILIVPHKSPLHKQKAVKALRAASYVLADSKYLLGKAELLTPLKNSEVIPWGIERKHLELYKDKDSFYKPLKIIVPRMHEKVYENEFIIESLSSIVKSGDVELTFPAFGSMVDAFRAKAGNLIGNGIMLYDKMTRDEFLRFFAKHDLYLSNSSSDSSPVSLIEAQALGLIPVVRDIPGVSELMYKDSGFKYQSGDSGELQKIITNILSSSDDFDTMRSQNYVRVMRVAIFELNVAQQVEIMLELISDRVSNA